MKLLLLSGKGGAGKTTVAVNLARTFADRGMTVALWDADVEEPDCRCFLSAGEERIDRVTRPVPAVDARRCDGCGACAAACAFNALALAGGRVLVFPELCHGCGSCRRLCPRGAVGHEERIIGEIGRGIADGIPLVTGRLRVGAVSMTPLIDALLGQVPAGGLHLIDGPPGTGCAAGAAVRVADAVILVAEPTPFGRHDLVLARALAATRELPAAVVINRGRGDDAETALRDWCAAEGLPVLGIIPAGRAAAAQVARGSLLVALPDYAAVYAALADRIDDFAGALA